ncbi:hypothetical protein [Oceaniglobus roseus]|uniref:hypothetical protein n=1 Tax=Oceaniglobus roseus TaxID=1737570 RepID=UPI000C7E8BD7|nr:hypothetical protein [Kandeliimicrobium roseum]
MRLLLVLLLLAACGRPLTPAERQFAATVQGGTLASGRVSVTKGALIGNVIHLRPARPALACREKIRRPETGTIRTSTAAFVLFQHMFVAQRLYRDDYLPRYPEEMSLAAAMLLAHELTHVWQWQNRKVTGYSPFKAAVEHSDADPYLFDLTARADFLDYGYEQQGGIVEEFVCCRALDPEGARTERLYDLLKPYFPGIEPRESTPREAIRLPWDGAETRGICS